MPFFTQSQNNSGGIFDINQNAGVTHFIIVEAENAEDAEKKINEIIGSYSASYDCPCCGERWCVSFSDEYDSDDQPMIYGDPVAEYVQSTGCLWMNKGEEACVHYSDGRKEWF